ncbi:MAG: hypothetical protein ACRDYZ_05545, partial [Acidimicrobiales bacterium]
NAAKSVLHVFSPSTLFMDIGRTVVEGLALGVTGNAAKAVGAMSSVASPLATVPFTAPSLSSLSVAGGASTPDALAQSVAAGTASSPGVPATPAPGEATGQAPLINVYVQTNATAHEIGTEVGWALRTAK